MKKMAKAMYGKTMMKGGASKMKKYKLGSAVNNTPGDDDKKKKKEKKEPPEFNTPIVKDEVSTTQRTYKNPLIARIGSYFTGKEYQKSTNPVTNMDITRTFEDGKKTRVIKVKNQKKEEQKIEEQKMGGAKIKKYKLGNAVNNGPGDGKTSAYSNAAQNPVYKKIAMDALGIKKPKPAKPRYPSEDVKSSKYGGTAKPKMMKGGTKPKNPIISNAEKALMDNKFYQKATAAVEGRTNSSFMKGGAKPKAMYGTAMKPGMMKKGGAKKK